MDHAARNRTDENELGSASAEMGFARPSNMTKTDQFRPGDRSGGATPVPIPNTAVKPSSADGTAVEALWESRSLPGHSGWGGLVERRRQGRAGDGCARRSFLRVAPCSRWSGGTRLAETVTGDPAGRRGAGRGRAGGSREESRLALTIATVLSGRPADGLAVRRILS